MPKPKHRKKKPPQRKPARRWLRHTIDLAAIWLVKAVVGVGLDRFSDWL